MRKLIALLFLFPLIAFGQGTPTYQVKTIADLVALRIPTISNRLSALVTGRVTENDGGGGLFFYDSASAVSTNLGTVFKPAASNGRWLREYSGELNLLWFKGDPTGSVDSHQSITNAVALVSTSGGTLFFPKGTYLVSDEITIPASVVLRGEGSHSSTYRYTKASGYAITVGSATGSFGAYLYGCRVSNMGMVLTSATGNGIQVTGTSSARLDSLYIEGVVGGASTAVLVKGGTIGTILTEIHNVAVNHCKFGVVTEPTGAVQTTSTQGVGITVTGDGIAGSIGFNVTTNSAVGASFVGGNVENFEVGVSLSDRMTSFVGVRFEGNTTDILLNAGTERNSFIGCVDIGTLTDNSNDKSNSFIANQSSSIGLQAKNQIQSLYNNGDITLDNNPAQIRGIFLTGSSTNTGTLDFQAGNNSAGSGGALSLYSHSHATKPGTVTAGVSSGSGGSFTVNSQPFGLGTDVFTVNGGTGNIVGNGTADIAGNVALGTITKTEKLNIAGNVKLTPDTSRSVIIDTNATWTGSFDFQGGGGSAGFGGGLLLRGHSHATNPGGVTVGISALSTGRFAVNNQGLGGGSDVAAIDINGNFQLNGDITGLVVGKGFKIKEGSNARMGTATLVGGTITVANTGVTANTRVFVSRSTTGGTPGHLSTTQIASTSFTVNSSDGGDTSTVNWLLIEPSP